MAQHRTNNPEADVLSTEGQTRETLIDDTSAIAVSLGGVVERLCCDHPTVSLAAMIDLVRRCRSDIDTGAPQDSIPELVERLARARLNE